MRTQMKNQRQTFTQANITALAYLWITSQHIYNKYLDVYTKREIVLWRYEFGSLAVRVRNAHKYYDQRIHTCENNYNSLTFRIFVCSSFFAHWHQTPTNNMTENAMTDKLLLFTSVVDILPQLCLYFFNRIHIYICLYIFSPSLFLLILMTLCGRLIRHMLA